MSAPGAPRRIALACQGGGSHTAFTAGVLARLFETGAVRGDEIVGISGTSGGAINALITWSRLVDGRPDDVGPALRSFWHDNAARGPVDALANLVTVVSGVAQDLGLAPPLNPYLVPPGFDGREAFRRLVRRHVDVDALRISPDLPPLVLGAVDVLSGEFRAFDSRTDRITADTVLASAAIPTLFRAVHVGDGVYWDGLFSQNPPVRELLDAAPDELWVVQINPSRLDREPETTLRIADRRDELAGNLSLNQELRGVERTNRMLEAGTLTADTGYRPVTVRVLEMPRTTATDFLGAASKLNREPSFLERLQRDGAHQADRFLLGLALERAWAAKDTEALAGLLGGASLRTAPPFDHLPAGSTAELLAGVVSVDATSRHVAGATTTWRVRAAGTPLAGHLTATVDGDRVTAVRLGD